MENNNDEQLEEELLREPEAELVRVSKRDLEDMIQRALERGHNSNNNNNNNNNGGGSNHINTSNNSSNNISRNPHPICQLCGAGHLTNICTVIPWCDVRYALLPEKCTRCGNTHKNQTCRINTPAVPYVVVTTIDGFVRKHTRLCVLGGEMSDRKVAMG